MVRHTQEIERKWLVRDLPEVGKLKCEQIIQGYLAISSDGTEVRIRRKGEKHFETVKTQGDLTRDELEIEISPEQFSLLWPATKGRRLEKTRYTLPWNSYQLELDVYQRDLDGLIIAELEFDSTDESKRFCQPGWLGEEVTDDKRYKNSSLALHGRPATPSPLVKESSRSIA
jgi:CYTH domain-containing protein